MAKSNTKGKTRSGRKHTKPLCVLYRKGDIVTAAMLSPINDNVREESSTGPHAALGLLKDQGYNFTDIHEDKVPDWVKTKVPKGVDILGTADITGFPL